MVYISLIIGRRVLDVKMTYGKSCTPNFWVGSAGFAITPSEYVEHAVFQIWTRISVASASVGMRFYEENISALEANFGWQEV